MKIKLTSEQVNQLIEKQAADLKKRHELEVAQLRKKFEAELSNLKKKFENYEINIEEDKPKRTRGKFNQELFLKLHNAGKGITEIAKELGVSVGYASTKKKALTEKKVKK